ncbi:MAG TPA: glycosyltransferase 87 family protein [Thermoleophilaceae bacterium]
MSASLLAARRDALAALALLAAGWALTLWVAPWSDERVNDLFVYRSFAGPLLDGALPYRDLAFEYPPLAAPAIAIPGLLGSGEESFRWAFAIWTLAGGAAVVLLCGALARATGGNPNRAMFAAALMPVLCGALVRTHFDLFPVAILLGGLLLVCLDRPRAGLAVLGLGAMTKLFPLVAVPVVLVWLVARGRRREAWQGGLACAATIAVVAGAALAVSPDGAADAVRYHLDRPVQIESSPAMLLLGLDAVGIGDAESVSSHRSDGLLHDASGALSALPAGLMVGLVLLLASRVGRTSRELVLASLAATIVFALFGKVLSPQFVIWALPLGALALAWRNHALAAAVAIAAVLTQVEFPAHYFDVVARQPLALALVAVRNAVLLAALVLALRELEPRRQEQLLDGRRTALAVRVD